MTVSEVWLSAWYGCQHDMAVSIIWLSAWTCCTKQELKIVRCRQVQTTTVTAVSKRYLSARYGCQQNIAIYIATIWLSLRHVRHVRPEDHHGPMWIVDTIVLQYAFWTNLCFNLHSGRKDTSVCVLDKIPHFSSIWCNCASVCILDAKIIQYVFWTQR